MLDDGGAGSIVITNGSLRIDVDTAVSLTAANNVTNLAANVADAGQAFSYTDSSGLDVTTVDTTVGVTTNGGVVTIATTTGTFTVTQAIAAGAAAVNLTASGVDQLLSNVITTGIISGNAATLTADNMDIDASIDVGAGAGLVTLVSDTTGILIDLGDVADATAGELQLSDAELGFATALTVRVGAVDAGNIDVTGATSPNNSTNLTLLTGGTVTQSAGTISTAGLRIVAVGAVTLTNASNAVTTLAANVTGAANAFSFTDSNALYQPTELLTLKLIPTTEPM